jgi:hypothetical protein
MANNTFLTMSGDKRGLNNYREKILEKFFPENSHKGYRLTR